MQKMFDLTNTGFAVTSGIFAFLVSMSPSAALMWPDVPGYRCSEIVSANGSYTDKTASVASWLPGYRDGITALAVFDKRLGPGGVGSVPLDQLMALVIVYCRNKQDLTVGEAVTGIFELTINSMPGGRTLDLAVPKR
jgi:hypothetical protein